MLLFCSVKNPIQIVMQFLPLKGVYGEQKNAVDCLHVGVGSIALLCTDGGDFFLP